MQKVMYEMNSERAGETDEQAYARAMRDPEVQEIMADPLMRQILQDSQQDPRALMDHMKNPMVSPVLVVGCSQNPVSAGPFSFLAGMF